MPPVGKLEKLVFVQREREREPETENEPGPEPKSETETETESDSWPKSEPYSHVLYQVLGESRTQQAAGSDR